jgi:hypothetical protein
VPAPAPAVNYTFEDQGPGYCGATEEEEIGNRLTSWFYGKTQEEAEHGCLSDPSCAGFHWKAKSGNYVLLRIVSGETCCDSAEGDNCFKKIVVTNGPTPAPTIYAEPYVEVGRGYCGQTEEEEVNNRIGTWVYNLTQREANEHCTQEPACQGYHWNDHDASFVLLSKVGNWTCCETAKGDSCMKRQIPHEDAQDTFKPPEGQVVFSFIVNNVDYLPIIDPFTGAVREAIAAESGSIINPDNVDVVISTGNVLEITITPPKGVQSGIVQSTLASSATLVQTIVGRINGLAGIQGHIRGTVTITDMSRPMVEAVFTGSAAHFHLDAAYGDEGAPAPAPNEPVEETPNTTTFVPMAPGQYLAPGQYMAPGQYAAPGSPAAPSQPAPASLLGGAKNLHLAPGLSLDSSS